MENLLTAKEARERRLVPTQKGKGELGRVLSKIEQKCYLQSGIYWSSSLSDEVIEKLKELGYKVFDVSVCDVPAYNIEWA